MNDPKFDDGIALAMIPQMEKGILVINKDQFVLWNYQDIWQGKLSKNNFEGFIVDLTKLEKCKVRTFLLKKDISAVLLIGETNHSNEEFTGIVQLMKNVGLEPENKTISSIVGINPIKHAKTDYRFQNKEQASIYKQANLESFLSIPTELAKNLDEFILTKLDFKTFEFSNNTHEKIKSLIVAVLVKQFLTSTYNYQAEDISGKEIIDISFMGIFPKCNICSSFDCEHIDIIFQEKSILSDLKKDGIIPIRFDFTEFQEEIENILNKIDDGIKSKARKNED